MYISANINITKHISLLTPKYFVGCRTFLTAPFTWNLWVNAALYFDVIKLPCHYSERKNGTNFMF